MCLYLRAPSVIRRARPFRSSSFLRLVVVPVVCSSGARRPLLFQRTQRWRHKIKKRKKTNKHIKSASGKPCMRAGVKRPATLDLRGVARYHSLSAVCCCCCFCRKLPKCGVRPGFPKAVVCVTRARAQLPLDHHHMRCCCLLGRVTRRSRWPERGEEGRISSFRGGGEGQCGCGRHRRHRWWGVSVYSISFFIYFCSRRLLLLFQIQGNTPFCPCPPSLYACGSAGSAAMSLKSPAATVVYSV